MEFIPKSHLLCFTLVLFAGQSLCQQPSVYSAASGQTKLDDIERDNLKTQSQPAPVPIQPQYLQYPAADQFVYQLHQQQQPIAYPVQQVQSQHTAAPAPLLTAGAPNQQQTVYTGVPQQPVIYFTQNGQPIDFSPITLAAGYPYVPSNGAAAGKISTGVPSNAKNVQTQIPTAYFLPQQYYQPIALSQPPNVPSQYYYNTLYQLQTPQKSVYSTGIKSTTPAIPIKGKDEQFVPIGGSGPNYYVANPNQFDKIRITGRV